MYVISHEPILIHNNCFYLLPVTNFLSLDWFGSCVFLCPVLRATFDKEEAQIAFIFKQIFAMYLALHKSVAFAAVSRAKITVLKLM